MARIRRPRARYFTAGVNSRRYLWWWAQQGDNTVPGSGIWLNGNIWRDSDRWRD